MKPIHPFLPAKSDPSLYAPVRDYKTWLDTVATFARRINKNGQKIVLRFFKSTELIGEQRFTDFQLVDAIVYGTNGTTTAKGALSHLAYEKLDWDGEDEFTRSLFYPDSGARTDELNQFVMLFADEVEKSEFEVEIDLANPDSNLPQPFRPELGYVELFGGGLAPFDHHQAAKHSIIDTSLAYAPASFNPRKCRISLSASFTGEGGATLNSWKLICDAKETDVLSKLKNEPLPSSSFSPTAFAAPSYWRHMVENSPEQATALAYVVRLLGRPTQTGKVSIAFDLFEDKEEDGIF